jgi:hypothetical protein
MLEIFTAEGVEEIFSAALCASAITLVRWSEVKEVS